MTRVPQYYKAKVICFYTILYSSVKGIKNITPNEGKLLIWMMVGRGLSVLAKAADWIFLIHFFSRLSFLFSFSLSLGVDPIYTEILSRPSNPK